MTSKHAAPHARLGRAGRPFSNPAFWLVPMIVVIALGMIGTALYLGGLSNPSHHFKNFPIALVNQDKGAQVPQQNGSPQHQNMGQQIADEFSSRANESDAIDLREISWDEAQDQLKTGQLFAVVVIPENFSKDTVSLVEGSLTDDSAAKPQVKVYTEPQAGSLGTRLATGAVEPGIHQASETIGKQLTDSIAPAEQQAYQRVLKQLQDGQQAQSRELERSAAKGGPAVQQFAQQVQRSQEGTAEQIAQQLAPTVSTVSREALADPIQMVSEPYQDLQDGTALGMGAFYYCILLLVVGFSGTIAVNLLMDSRLGVTPFEMGPVFRDLPRTVLPRSVLYLVKWGAFVVAAAPASALMMWVADLVGMPVPHGFTLWLVGWLSMAAVSAIVLALVTLGGSAGMLLSLIYLVFMGLPSAGAVVPLQAVPAFFRDIAPFEPLHHIFTAVRSVLYFDASGPAGLTSGVVGLVVMLLVAVALGLLVGLLYDRRRGMRGGSGRAKHAAGADDAAAAVDRDAALPQGGATAR